MLEKMGNKKSQHQKNVGLVYYSAVILPIYFIANPVFYLGVNILVQTI
jgi:hypothetical protein